MIDNRPQRCGKQTRRTGGCKTSVREPASDVTMATSSRIKGACRAYTDTRAASRSSISVSVSSAQRDTVRTSRRWIREKGGALKSAERVAAGFHRRRYTSERFTDLQIMNVIKEQIDYAEIGGLTEPIPSHRPTP